MASYMVFRNGIWNEWNHWIGLSHLIPGLYVYMEEFLMDEHEKFCKRSMNLLILLV